MKLKYILTAVILIIVAGLIYLAITTNSSKNENNMPNEQSQNVPPEGTLKIEDIVIGSGTEAKTGNTISVNYVGTLLGGTKFDSSYDRGVPFEFTLGQNRVIQGWERGILGMKAGGKRRLIIPPSLAYGANGIPGAIPGNATLIFEVEMLEIK